VSKLSRPAGSTGRSGDNSSGGEPHQTLGGIADNRERSAVPTACCFPPMWTSLFDRHLDQLPIPGVPLPVSMRRARDALRCWDRCANLIRPFSREQETFLHAIGNALRH